MKENIVIIGAGISGLTTAYFLNKPNVVLEAKPYAGGLCHSFYEDGFTFDCSGHFIHMRDEKIKKLVNKLAKGTDEIVRNTSIYLKDNFIPFPFQANLSYLDEKTKKECVNGILKRKDIEISTQMPFIDWSNAMFGKGITKYFMQPYNQKLWSYDLKKMTAAWTGPFVPKPDAQSIVDSAYKKSSKSYGYNATFYYPKKNGCKALIDGLIKKVNPLVNSKTKKIDLKNKTVQTDDGREFKYTKVVSTQPITELVNQIKNVPLSVKKASSKLICTSVRCINIGVKSKSGIPKVLKDRHWVYIPEKSISFYRIGIYSNINKSAVPKNNYSFYVEFSSDNDKYKNSDNVVMDLKKLGFIKDNDEIAAINIVDMPYAYVIFDKEREKALKIINDFLNKNNIYSVGRYGAWEYSFIEKNMQDAIELAKRLNN